MHAVGIRSPSKILGLCRAAPCCHRGKKRRIKLFFLEPGFFPLAPPSHICIYYFERRVRLGLFINCSSWADPTHSWALAAGSAFPASRVGSLAKPGLRAWQQSRRRLAAPREDELANAVKPGFWSLVGSRKWVTGGDRVCFPYCCSPSVSRKMFLVRQR